MKILWIVNLMLPDIAAKLNKKASNREGWLSGTLRAWDNSREYTLAIAFPMTEEIPEPFVINGIKCYPFYEDLSTPEVYKKDIEDSFRVIFEDYKPDLLHIFGTEFPHGLAALKVFDNPKRTLVGIQGVCRKIAEDYLALIPDKVAKEKTFRDILRKDSIKDQQKKFFKRAENEKNIFKLTMNVTGRTDFDKEESIKANPLLNYYLMNETMRSSFYEERWDINKVRRHSIFIGQGDYPIKGMHFALMAFGRLIEKYPDMQIYIAGNSIIDHKSLKDKLKTPAYGKYLRKLIRQNKLTGHITVLGSIDELRMREQYLHSHVYICPSYVENSPNTVAEAMLLGMPVIASMAGGIPSIISEREGFLFQRGDVLALSERIDEVFALPMDALKVRCDNAYERAHLDYEPSRNHERLLEIYEMINSR